ncbi:MAG: polysaccharide biosynthesis tyrosine autokinase [Anaerolineae bacterium]
MELKQYFGVIWKWLWLIVLATGIAAGASYYATSRQPKIYQASTKIMVGQSLQATDPNTLDIYTSQQLAPTYIQIAKTGPVLQGTIDKLGLKMAPEQLAGMINAAPIQGTQLIQLNVIDTDPARAQSLANEVSRQLTLQGPASTEQDQAKRRDFIQQRADELQKKITDGQKSIDDLQTSIQVTSSAREIADKQQQVATLQQQITQWEQTYAAMLSFLSPKSANYLTIIEPATLPVFPIGPNPQQNLLVAGMIGLLLALGGAFLIEYLDDTIKSGDDVAKLLKHPVIGAIARIPGAVDERLIAANSPRASITEAYRVLRTNIQFSSLDKPVKTFVVTSAGPTEGKSVTAANLAVVMAQAGLRTVLVDGDMRKPSQHRLFKMTNDVGLTNGLISQTALETFVRPTKVDNLRIVTTGPLPPNPSEVLGSERFHKLKAQLEAEADIVIFDSPPSLILTDAALLSRLTDGVVLVVDAGHTRREQAVRALETIEKVGGHILGIVINRVRPRGSGYYYYYYYYYSNDGSSSRRRKQSPGEKRSLLPQWFKRSTPGPS